MSYDIYLKNIDGSTCETENHTEGGTFVLGGTPTCELNVTYNYSQIFRVISLKSWEGIFSFRDLTDKTGKETLEVLEEIVELLGTKQYKDYWAPTPGNVGYAANILLEWAKEHPNATWEVHA